MDRAQVLELLKARIGILSTIRDTYLTMIIDAVLSELGDEKGIMLEHDNANHLMLVVDYCAHRYLNRDSEKGIPRHLQYRIHNLLIHNGG